MIARNDHKRRQPHAVGTERLELVHRIIESRCAFDGRNEEIALADCMQRILNVAVQLVGTHR